MRVAVLSHSRRRIGGAEQYLETLLPGLLARGHHAALWTETDAPADRPPIRLPAAGDVPDLRGATELDALRAWRPDVLYTHGLLDPTLEARALRDLAAPAVCLAHGYYGACVSGNKTWSFPRPPTVCPRAFGPGCLLHYYPHRCGGLNPRTLWRDYRLQARRQRLLRDYAARAVFSEHMAAEYRRYGLDAEVLPILPTNPDADDTHETAPPPWDELRLLFLGRMEPLKGGAMLLDALPEVLARNPSRRVRCDLAGQGSAEAGWRERATRLTATHGARLAVRFHGWVGGEERRELLRASHLLVVPSLWPEPLGLVGGEGAALGVPSVAFHVGGIPEWLRDGENGSLAPADPPTPRGLADAIARAVADPAAYARLQRGARTSAAGAEARAARHFEALETLFGRVVSGYR